MVLRWFQRLGLRVVDLVILSVALAFITSSAVAAGDFALLSLDFLSLLLIVFITYVVVVVLVKVLTLSIPETGMLSRFAKGAISGLLVFFLFSYVVGALMFLLSYRLTADVQAVLLVVSVLRAVVGGLLGRRLEGA